MRMAETTSDVGSLLRADGASSCVDPDRSGSALAAIAPDAFEIILQPVSHPETGDIGIDESLFAIGRTEPPFDGFPASVVADLSRRHARIFCENGIVHIADMGSKNGTAVNDVDIRQRTARLQDGDEIRFGRFLTFRVHLRTCAPPVVARMVSLTLLPVAHEEPLGQSARPKQQGLQEQAGVQPHGVAAAPVGQFMRHDQLLLFGAEAAQMAR